MPSDILKGVYVFSRRYRTTDMVCRPRMRKLVAGLLLATLVAIGAAPVSADETLQLRRGNLGNDLDFIDKFLKVLEPDFYRPTKDFGEGFREMTLDDIYVGRFDVNGDDVEELFVFVYYSTWCGKTGCNMHVFERGGGDWVEVVYARPYPRAQEDDGQRVYGLSVWTDPETGYKTVYASSSGFRWTGERYEHIDDARILELQAESFDFAGMDRHFAPGSDGLDTSGFDPDKVGDETDWNRGALRHLAPFVRTFRFGAVINDTVIWAALGGIMDRKELAYVILFMPRAGLIYYDRGYLVLQGSREPRLLDDGDTLSVETSIIVVDTRDGSVHAGIQRNSGKTIYSLAEGYAELPAPFDKWLHRGDGIGLGVGADHNLNATWVRKPQAPE